jgi:ABC-type dipeptide/oligopeptide/nickel transport system ATPase subunit
MSVTVSVKHLVVAYGAGAQAVRALDDVDVEIAPGERVGLVG